MFEGLGLGSRLAILPLAKKWNWVAPVAAATYACITPLGIAIGLGIRTT
jgi:zinc transporter 1/2/3